MAKIHPTALVDPKASLEASVEIGPYSIIGPDVVIGAGTRVGPGDGIRVCENAIARRLSARGARRPTRPSPVGLRGNGRRKANHNSRQPV